ncbi:MAG: antitoxin, partial [Actinomycetota bacterium]
MADDKGLVDRAREALAEVGEAAADLATPSSGEQSAAATVRKAVAAAVEAGAEAVAPTPKKTTRKKPAARKP